MCSFRTILNTAILIALRLHQASHTCKIDVKPFQKNCARTAFIVGIHCTGICCSHYHSHYHYQPVSHSITFCSFFFSLFSFQSSSPSHTPPSLYHSLCSSLLYLSIHPFFIPPIVLSFIPPITRPLNALMVCGWLGEKPQGMLRTT